MFKVLFRFVADSAPIFPMRSNSWLWIALNENKIMWNSQRYSWLRNEVRRRKLVVALVT